MECRKRMGRRFLDKRLHYYICRRHYCYLDLLSTLYYLYYKKGKSFWTISFQALSINLLALIIRAVYFAVDPYGYREILDSSAQALLFWVPVLLWLDVGFLVVLYWVELCNMSRIEHLLSLKKYRPYLIGIIISSAVLILPLCFWDSFSYSFASRTTLDLFLALYLLSIVAFSTYHGIRLLRFIRGLYMPHEIFLKKVTYFLFGTNFFLLSSVILLVIYVVVGANPWFWVSMESLLRICEFGGVIFILFLLQKKLPERSSKNTGSSHDINHIELSASK